MNAPGRPPSAVHLDQLRSDARRIADVLDTAPLDARVAACPEWTVSDLVGHLGRVHRWALDAVSEGQRPSRSPNDVVRPADASLGAWLIEGADALADALGVVRDDAPSWNPFGSEQVAAFWPRRQSHETMVHRWDIEHAAGATTPMPPELASDAIDELFEVIVPRGVARGSITLPAESLHVHCTDVAGEWLLWSDEEGRLGMRREHAKGDAAMRGPAESLLLALWGRTPVPGGDGDGHDADRGDSADKVVDVVGDVEVAARWSRLTG
jgi:uncharacterized protein (TIGR03083 family)